MSFYYGNTIHLLFSLRSFRKHRKSSSTLKVQLKSVAKILFSVILFFPPIQKVILSGLDKSKAFKLKFFEGYGEKFGKAGIQITGVELGVLNGSKLFKNFDGLVSSVETINDFDRGRTSGLKDGYDTFKEYISVGQTCRCCTGDLR